MSRVTPPNGVLPEIVEKLSKSDARLKPCRNRRGERESFDVAYTDSLGIFLSLQRPFLERDNCIALCPK
jgi:hypothetical protein